MKPGFSHPLQMAMDAALNACTAIGWAQFTNASQFQLAGQPEIQIARVRACLADVEKHLRRFEAEQPTSHPSEEVAA